jgi:hypothetical protein
MKIKKEYKGRMEIMIKEYYNLSLIKFSAKRKKEGWRKKFVE